MLKFSKKNICIYALLLVFLTFLTINNYYERIGEQTIKDVISPVEFSFENGEIYKIENCQIFDAGYTQNNKILAEKLKITEDEAFILGNLGMYFTKNILLNRKVHPQENDLIYNKFSYSTRLENSPFCIKDGTPANPNAFQKQIEYVKKSNYVIIDLDTDKSYKLSEENLKNIKNFVLIRKGNIKTNTVNNKQETISNNSKYPHSVTSENIKLIVSDFTSKTMPDRNCSSDICREILSNINKSKTSIDIAIYGYSSTPVIEEALKNAVARGVKIRLIYDIDSQGNNIYPDTGILTKLISEIKNDSNSKEVNNTMHDKFYIFDSKIVITGSANLSHTDMSGYNSNIIAVINSEKTAKFFEDEFNQMFSGKFHNDKISIPNKTDTNIEVFFSPQDKPITNRVLRLIQDSKQYIYIPAFVITEKRITSELIKAKNRGVDVKVITDALNASTQHSKHKELRAANISVKAENYAGKMHSKSMIIDDTYVVLGSMNFSNSGENKNDENVIVLKDTKAAKFYREFFEYQWNKIPDKWLKYTPRAEGKDSIGSCSDGIDNNYDGKTDKDDTACKRKN